MDSMAMQGRIGAISGGGLDRLTQSDPLGVAGRREITPAGDDFGQMLSDAIGRTEEADESAAAGDKSFSQSVTESIDKVNHLMNESDRMVEDLATGRSANVHGTLIALQKADISFRMLLEVRSKVLKAYEEVMRMQV
ncbi:MAG: flagellar hook-basal body complex protein FliE [bacterium]|nr:flagellar hook-basal body complex protein FliE [bacterium]